MTPYEIITKLIGPISPTGIASVKPATNGTEETDAVPTDN